MSTALRDTILGDPRKVGLLRNMYALRATRARHDISAFFEFVMRSHPENASIKVAPHQRVFLDFVLAHERSVGILPIGGSKTFLTTGLTLDLLGKDNTSRGAVVSAAQAQAAKTVGMVSDYILHSPELRLVYPHLRPSARQRDPWTQTAITVDRPPGIPDPSLVAVGFDGAVAGARLNWIIIDDLLSAENTATPEQRKKTISWLDSTVLRRLDPQGSRVVVINTAWHPEDVVHVLEKAGWATLRMDVLGGVQVQDDLGRMETMRRLGLPWEPWEHPELRPASNDPGETFYRLRSHDPDPSNEVPLWPERYPTAWIEQTRESIERTSGAAEFNRAYMGVCRDDESAMCKVEWVEACKAAARAVGHFNFVREYRGPNPVVTGVDLAFRQGRSADKTCIFTVECLPTGPLPLTLSTGRRVAQGARRILEIQLGQWDAPEIIRRLIDVEQRYRSIIRVEDNGAQLAIQQMLRSMDASLPVKAHYTGTNKASQQYGVQSVFLDMQNVAWIIPNDQAGRVRPEVAAWVEGCLYYSPNAHTHDALMASWMAREQARHLGVLHPSQENGMRGGAVGMEIMSR
jgi:hypothetical protein